MRTFNQKLQELKNNFKCINKKILCFIYKNWFEIIVIIILFIMTVQMININTDIKTIIEDGEVLYEKAEEIYGVVEGFYSDWFYGK